VSERAARVVRRRDYRETPWRNGGGVTYEIAREPPDVDAFEWRLSLARIERGGPFSDFSGYRRALTLVSGEGCRLRGLRPEPWELRESGATALFDGGAAVTCELIRGVCEDLNLMVREPGRILSVDHFSLLGHDTEPLGPQCAGAVFCLEGEVECLHLTRGERITLGACDTLLVDAAQASEWRLLRGAAAPARVIVHSWRVTGD
jgi:environmental stress-induced protein Ves